MAKLNQIIAIEKGVKARTYGELSLFNKTIQKSELFNGLIRTYQPKDDDGEVLPPENKKIQYDVETILKALIKSETEAMEITARKDWTNNSALADLKIDGSVIISGVPVTYLLFLEKKVTDLRAFISNLPVLDGTEDWTKDANSGYYKADPTQTHRTKKVPKVVVKYAATDKHPAQTEMIQEDIVVGYWNQTKQSGAIPATDKAVMIERANKLLDAIKATREAANNYDEISVPDVGGAIFKYLLG